MLLSGHVLFRTHPVSPCRDASFRSVGASDSTAVRALRPSLAYPSPSPPHVVGSMKRDPMTSENDDLSEELLAQMKQPQLGVPEYSADPVVLRRLGRALSEISESV